MGYITQYNETEKPKQENPCNVCMVSSVVYLQAHVGVKYVAPILLMTKLTHLDIRHGLLYITCQMNDTSIIHKRRASHKALFYSLLQNILQPWVLLTVVSTFG